MAGSDRSRDLTRQGNKTIFTGEIVHLNQVAVRFHPSTVCALQIPCRAVAEGIGCAVALKKVIAHQCGDQADLVDDAAPADVIRDGVAVDQRRPAVGVKVDASAIVICDRVTTNHHAEGEAKLIRRHRSWDSHSRNYCR